ncbi:hypothetical protein TNCV_2178001 [Trichonephila clavipes]|uniref:Uncharacterized protein n=1 Tax=Trichonephila clavipes TaxID=2585209 RepID=A0A8X6VU85_TRICX|nr:hypothetical protein TNCV_2178001 [Trichonephila clavipes]
MDVCKYIVPVQQGGTLNSRRVTSPDKNLVEGDERVLKATDNHRRKSLAICLRQVALKQQHNSRFLPTNKVMIIVKYWPTKLAIVRRIRFAGSKVKLYP